MIKESTTIKEMMIELKNNAYLLRKIIGAYLGVSPDEVVISTKENEDDAE